MRSRDWRRLRQSNGYSFGEYARFLNANPGWPGEATLRKYAENAMHPGENAGTVLAFFQAKPPTTGGGYARLAEALSASGRQAEALEAAKEAWASDDLSATDEPAVYARYGASFTRADHDRRADALLFAKKPNDAYRFLTLVSPNRAAAFTARVAMQTKSPDAEARYQPLMANVTSDAGLMMDRARYLRDAGYEQAAQQLFARPHNFTYRPADPERLYEMMLLLSTSAASQSQWRTAYDIARQVDDAFPAGTDISLKSLGVRDDYTSLTWLAGSAALDALGRPAEAIGLFQRYSRGGRSLQVLSKGLYWAGRAALAAGRATDAAPLFPERRGLPRAILRAAGARAAGPLGDRPAHRRARGHRRPAHPVQRQPPGPGDAAARPAGPPRRAGACSSARWPKSLQTDGERALALELGQQIGRQDIAGVGRPRRAQQGLGLFRPPGLSACWRPAFRAAQYWSLTHGITRQESSFDRTAVSHAGARGMMQLMPGTAREQAGKMGLGYDGYRLTSDPAYNVMLGSAYFSRLLNNWDGNVPLAVASYNAGSGNVRKWVNAYGDPRTGTDVLRWIEAIPFAETKGYVQRVIENSVVYDLMRPSQTPQSALHVSRYLGKSRPG